MKKQMLIAACALMLMASPVAAQGGSGRGSGAGAGTGEIGETPRYGSGDRQATTSNSSSSQTTTTQKDGRTTTTTVKTEESASNPRFVRTLTNVQIELTLTDQLGTQTPEKKTVSMIVSSGNWGKIRSAANIMLPGESPFVVDLNVDARPFVSTEGLIQLEMTLVYSPPTANKSTIKERPTGMNQSLTVVLQSGKPMIVSQAADPVSDRKVVVEVKATVLK